MKYLLVFIVLISSGCGKSNVRVDAAFTAQYFAFVNEAQVQGIEINTDDITIEFGDTGTAIGVCKTPKSHPAIVIDKTYWEASTDSFKEQLIFHELGHCILKRNHTRDEIDGRPKSIMNPNSLRQYEEFRSYYVHELFNP